jgi:hypothetical protein
VTSTKTTGAQLTEAKKLRAEGESLHKAGKHADSVTALNKALSMIGAK